MESKRYVAASTVPWQERKRNDDRGFLEGKNPIPKFERESSSKNRNFLREFLTKHPNFFYFWGTNERQRHLIILNSLTETRQSMVIVLAQWIWERGPSMEPAISWFFENRKLKLFVAHANKYWYSSWEQLKVWNTSGFFVSYWYCTPPAFARRDSHDELHQVK